MPSEFECNCSNLESQAPHSHDPYWHLGNCPARLLVEIQQSEQADNPLLYLTMNRDPLPEATEDAILRYLDEQGQLDPFKPTPVVNRLKFKTIWERIATEPSESKRIWEAEFGQGSYRADGEIDDDPTMALAADLPPDVQRGEWCHDHKGYYYKSTSWERLVGNDAI